MLLLNNELRKLPVSVFPSSLFLISVIYRLLLQIALLLPIMSTQIETLATLTHASPLPYVFKYLIGHFVYSTS